jgi:hypothetical protein
MTHARPRRVAGRMRRVIGLWTYAPAKTAQGNVEALLPGDRWTSSGFWNSKGMPLANPERM